MATMTPVVAWSSDRTLRIELGDRADEATAQRVARVREAIVAASIAGVVDVTPAYACVQVRMDHRALAIGTGLAESIEAAVVRAVHATADFGSDSTHNQRTVNIPVVYGGEFGPDLETVATERGLNQTEVIVLHSGTLFRVHFLGFAPGFAYLGGLPNALHSPRLSVPRARVPAGSVAIAGTQAGVYPSVTPGGWRILGRTHFAMFDAGREPQSLLRAGDCVRFTPVTVAEHEAALRGRAL